MNDGTGAGSVPYDETISNDPASTVATTLLLHAERPVVTKTWVRGRLAVITRRAVTVRKTFEIDVQHEELIVEYERCDDAPALERGNDRIVVQLRAEQIEFVKTVRVVEEVALSKRIDTETRRADLALRREELAVETART